MSAKLIRRKTVLEKIALGHTRFHELINEGFFPKPVQITPYGKAVGWLESEVDAWINERVAASRNSITPSK